MTRWTLLLLVGCQCGGPAPEPIDPGVPHFGTFHGLVRAAVKGDVEGAKWIAASLAEGDVPEVLDDGGGASAVGGALGFVQMAEDPAEVADGLAAAAVGCGQCHQAAGITQPPMGLWSHENAGLRLVLGAVFPPLEAPPGDVEPLGPVREAWDAAEGDEEKLAAAIAACAACHQAGE